ncbi:MAG: Abi family protein [Candidatus Delongbacteria bacterium]|nr:Abi family protein [Candidatus Delongbacteria bacterium]
MKYSTLEYYISQPRLKRYLTATNNSKTKAMKLYQKNLRVSQAFYPILNLFEIFLRNVIDYQISSHFANPNWIITEKNGFMNNPSLLPSKYFLKNSVANAEKTIAGNKGKIPVTSGKVIAELSFGFWTSLFQKYHYKLIGGVVIHCFPKKPLNVNRHIINNKLNNIRLFRNRIYHNEPICFNGNDIDFSNAKIIRKDIYELLEWIDVDLVKYTSAFDSIDKKIN